MAEPIKWITVGGKHVPIFDDDQDEEEWVEIDAWYDRHTRDWVIQKKDKNGYQVGEADRVGTKADKDYIVKELQAELKKRKGGSK